MKINLTKTLLINFIIIILVSLITTGLISTYMIDNRFDVYLLEEHKEKIKNIQSIINSAIEKNRSHPDFAEEGLTRYALLENYYVRITDADNNLIYTTGKSHLMQNRIIGMGHNMIENSKNHRDYPKKQNRIIGMGHNMMGPMMGRWMDRALGTYQEDVYTIELGDRVYGRVTIGYFGKSNMSAEAMVFKSTLYKSMLISLIIAILIGVLTSLLVSRQLGIPIKKITRASREITEGNLSVRTDTKTHIKEIYDLAHSINYLASSLQKQESLRKRLTSDMAHEIRTPIATVKSHIEAFLDGIWEATPDKIKTCHDEINRLSSLVENLEDINRLQKANHILDKTTFNLTEELRRIIDSIIPQFNKKNLKLNFQSKVNLNVFMDKGKFKQIMYNLLSNAFKYSYEGGTVNVDAYVENKNLIIKVQDFGMGISPTDLPHIFEHLYRGDPSRTRTTGGSGIGLTITKTLVEAHGGRIVAESDKEKGTVFTVTFPLSSLRKGT